jgi:chaperonin GroEL
MRIQHWWFTTPLRLRSLLRSRQVEQELDEELRFHLENKIEEGIAFGLSPAEARHRALRAMGGLEQHKEEMRESRRVHWLTDFFADVRYALRSLRRVIVTEHGCTFVEGAGSEEAVRTRLGQIRQEAERAPHENDREIARERLAKLASKLAVIHVGGATEVVLDEKRHRTEGALAATRAAVAEGIVPGGGTALLRAEEALEDLGLEGDYATGADLVRRVLSEPLFWIATNAGYDGQAAVDQVRAAPAGAGLNALTGEFGDLSASGVIDPVRVTRLTIENAASVAALLLTTEAIVAEELLAQPGAIMAPGFGDLAEGLARPSSPV